jgi:hypothetical protein
MEIDTSRVQHGRNVPDPIRSRCLLRRPNRLAPTHSQRVRTKCGSGSTPGGGPLGRIRRRTYNYELKTRQLNRCDGIEGTRSSSNGQCAVSSRQLVRERKKSVQIGFWRFTWRQKYCAYPESNDCRPNNRSRPKLTLPLDPVTNNGECEVRTP